MPCLPGFVPVTRLVHAGGVNAGMVESRFPQAPSRMRRWRVGISPFSARGTRLVHVAPSSPMTSTRFVGVMVSAAEPTGGWYNSLVRRAQEKGKANGIDG